MRLDVKATLYSGHVYIWSYETQQIVKTFELTDVPARAGRFIARKNCVVCGSDAFQIRVYNYNTSEKITQYKANPDYIRAIVVHPTQLSVLIASNDMTIKLWDWAKGWKNARGTNTFASACLNRTGALGSSTLRFQLEAHETKGGNRVDYYPHSDKPYILTTSDDKATPNNVSFACYHPELPIIISGSKDLMLTYRFEQSLNDGLERAWCVAYQKGKQGIAVGFDDGLVVKKFGPDHAHQQSLIHSPNGRSAAICGDGERSVKRWNLSASKDNSNDFAIRVLATNIKDFKNFQEKKGRLDIPFAADGLTGGVLLGVKGQAVRRIEVEPKQVYRSERGELVALACEDTTYVLRFSRESYNEAVQNGQVDDDGVEAAFSAVTDINESIQSVEWLGDTYTVAHFDKPMYILGYLQRDSKVYLINKHLSVTSFALSLPVPEYQTLVLRGDMEMAAELLSSIPYDQLKKIARFLKGQRHKELALEVATDPEHEFDLALALNQPDIARKMARKADPDHKWKTLGDAGLATWDVPLRQSVLVNAKDPRLPFAGLHFVLRPRRSRQAGRAGLRDGRPQCYVHYKRSLGDVPGCIDVLVKTNRFAEAWKKDLEKNKKGRVAKSLGMPGEDEALFPEWDEWLLLEKEGPAVAGEANAKEAADEVEDAEDAKEEGQEEDVG
ncbi:hypothetical protein N657DRAFT_708916 [Parathielavia appendiculata]|uniref:Beta'-coat protein n=1 Tax=Parathielavia appendiculata TaxID=2587402 RepID=A0AAN6Z6B7_9PEZI|nr:hypothetical protein N657DRAFT_708916 [Parathielavia appendiculata]